jgi:hypothetical protein
MDTSVDQRLELLEEAISQLQTQQLTESISGTQSSHDVLFMQSGNQLSIPIQSSITLPKGYKAENVSGITMVSLLDPPNYWIDDNSFSVVNNLFFNFFILVAGGLLVALFAFYIKSFLFEFLFPKFK